MKTISSFLKVGLVIGALSLSAASYGSVACNLGETCSVPNTLDSVYYSFKPEQGHKFACELRATKGDDLEVAITNGRDYIFPDQNVRAPKDGQVLTTTIPGYFKEGATSGEIKIHQSLLTSNAEGTVRCFATE